MEENVKKEAQSITDDESAYPGTPLSNTANFDVKKAIEDVKKYGKTDHLLAHSGYGHMSTTQLLALAKARKEVTIPNPNVNPQWNKIMEDGAVLAISICMVEDLEVIQDAIKKFLDVKDSHELFIRKALARSILKTEMKCRDKYNKIEVDNEKLKIALNDETGDSLKKYLNDTFGNPYKKILPNMDMNSLYVYDENKE